MPGRRVVLKETYHPTGTELFLTFMKEEHLEHLIELAHDSVLPDLMGWNPFFESGETEQFIKALSCCALPYSRESEPLVFGVYLNLEDFPVGYAVLKGMNTELRTAEVGVAVLDRKYRTKGYGRLVLRRVVKYAFEELRIKTVGAAVLAAGGFRHLLLFRRAQGPTGRGLFGGRRGPIFRDAITLQNLSAAIHSENS